jgi:hypothetical protein
VAVEELWVAGGLRVVGGSVVLSLKLVFAGVLELSAAAGPFPPAGEAHLNPTRLLVVGLW